MSDLMRLPRYVCGILTALILTGSAGCGSGETGPVLELIPVTGTVTMDGKPLASATVTFNPTGATKGNGAFAITDEQGKFTLTDYQQNPGCPAGEYGVTFSKITQPDGSPIPPGATRETVGMVERIPMVYNVFKPHAIIQGATVKSPESTFEFRLDSKFRPPHSFLQ